MWGNKIQFKVEYTNKNQVGQLVYAIGDHSFNFDPQAGNPVTSLLVNDVQIEIDKDGKALYVWGFCPSANWLEINDIVN